MKSKQRVVKWQPTRDKDTLSDSPYQQWVDDRMEPALANPDMLPHTETHSEADEFASTFINDDGTVSLLSKMEQKIFDLHIKQGMNIAEVHRQLKISKSSVRVYFKRMQKKLKTLYSSL